MQVAIEFLKHYQLDIMLFISGICGVLACLTLVMKTLTPKRRRILALLELAAMSLLLADRCAYIYRGDPSEMGFYMVRICNFLVYFFTLYIPHVITLYLYDLYRNEGKMKDPPKRLLLCEVLFLAGVIMLVISQFTGLYYTFDAQNNYQRAPAFFVCYIMPVAIILLQQSVVIQYRRLLSKPLTFALVMNTFLPVLASILQLFAYGVSLTNMTTVGMAVVVYVYALVDLNQSYEKARKAEIDTLKKAHKHEHALFEQTAEALANAIDAKDAYTHGHSSRVAVYSQQIARAAGLSDEECEQVYFAALLHDVGKIGVPDQIINKNGRLTDEEFAEIKKHPVYGNQILSSIQQEPYLSIGAHFHHERYDGRGYPNGLRGDDIPEIARIISVADSYDAMTSKRSYRDTIPQQKVREELVKGMGTQFDAKYAKIMLHLIDIDLEYHMREQAAGDSVAKTRLHCESIYHDCSVGIFINDKITHIRLFYRSDEGYPENTSIPTAIIFDALDGRVHADDDKSKELLYFEYAKISFDGKVECEGARKTETSVFESGEKFGADSEAMSDIKTSEDTGKTPEDTGKTSEDTRKTLDNNTGGKALTDKNAGSVGQHFRRCDIDVVRYKDHMLMTMSDGETVRKTIIALPDNARFAYISFTGEHCVIMNIRADQTDEQIGEGYIPRIAEEVSYIKDCPTGDIPNVQIDGWRYETSEGVPIDKDVCLRFHSMSLPTARLVWHCPYISVYTSEDGSVDGPGYQEFVLVRIDGENWESDIHEENKVNVSFTEAFTGWIDWKDKNKEGLDCEVTAHREGNVITIKTENFGIAIRSVTTIKDENVGKIYVALTGDQVAITDIHIS